MSVLASADCHVVRPHQPAPGEPGHQLLQTINPSVLRVDTAPPNVLRMQADCILLDPRLERPHKARHLVWAELGAHDAETLQAGQVLDYGAEEGGAMQKTADLDGPGLLVVAGDTAEVVDAESVETGHGLQGDLEAA